MNMNVFLFIANAFFGFINICMMIYSIANYEYWDRKTDKFLRRLSEKSEAEDVEKAVSAF